MKYLVLLVFLFFSPNVFAATAEKTEDMNFGTYIQTATTASGVLSNASAISGLNGLVTGSSSTKASAIVKIKGSGLVESVRFSSSGSVVLANTTGCTITVSDFTFNQNSPLILWLGASKDIKIGATVNISGGFCGEGTFHGTGSITYGSSSARELPFFISAVPRFCSRVESSSLGAR